MHSSRNLSSAIRAQCISNGVLKVIIPLKERRCVEPVAGISNGVLKAQQHMCRQDATAHSLPHLQWSIERGGKGREGAGGKRASPMEY